MTTEQKIVLVTGAGSGIGRLTAETLARSGHRVFASMRDPEGRNAETALELRTWAEQESRALSVIDLDVTDEILVKSAVGEVIEDAGRIDVVINNAGVVGYGVIESFTVEQTQRLFDVNLFGAMRVNRAAVPGMRERGRGLLIHVSSAAGRIVMPAMGIYCASKFALEALAETYRYELAGLGVDSVVVEPGVYPTRINDAPWMPEDSARNQAYGPLAEAGARLHKQFRDDYRDRDPREVADAIAGLVEMAPGTRPLRTLVGAEAQAVKPIIVTGAEVQGEFFEAFGMPELARITA